MSNDYGGPTFHKIFFKINESIPVTETRGMSVASMSRKQREVAWPWFILIFLICLFVNKMVLDFGQ